jgi:8-oxo-dGTP pyrophosphatase MutT (NUDIX family)
MYCNNCFEKDHFYKNCEKPLMSYGLCCYKNEKDNLYFLMIQKRNTYTYIEFIRGIYDILNIKYLQKMFDKMNISEKNAILNNKFKKLWNDLWLINELKSKKDNRKNKNEFYKGIMKFNILKNGYLHENNQLITLKYLIEQSSSNYNMNEWYFPKGKKEKISNNVIENNIQTAIREFSEETNIDLNNINVLEYQLEETHIGSNNKKYQTFFYIAEFLGSDMNLVIENYKNNSNKYQKVEINDMKWINIDNLHNYFRSYELSKLKLIDDLKKKIKVYNIK